ncbi:MAG: PAS domain-containing protein, partial [Methylocella sp.]
MSGTSWMGQQGSNIDWLAGGGEMGALIRAFDWSQTPVGPIETWPQSLKTALHIILNSRYPMFIWWGAEFTNLYNDAYIPMLGARHPAALAVSAGKVWSEIWDIVGPQAEIVLREERATWNNEVLLVMERNNFAEETYFTWSYSPIADDFGKISGVFCACTEDTRRVLGERRLRTLRDLGERGLVPETAEQACRTAAASLAENPHDLPFVLIYLLDEDGKQARLCETINVAAGTKANPGMIVIGNEGNDV